ncbi:FAD-binding protein [Streptomyces stramineus]
MAVGLDVPRALLQGRGPAGQDRSRRRPGTGRAAPGGPCRARCHRGRLVRHLVRRGWTLPVVPELEALTVGGLAMGFGIETSSHRHGLFTDIVESYDVLLGTGEVVRASATENSDLFRALPWSRGSLGFVVAAELRVVPARPWVEVRYHPVSDVGGCAGTWSVSRARRTGPRSSRGSSTGPPRAWS